MLVCYYKHDYYYGHNPLSMFYPNTTFRKVDLFLSSGIKKEGRGKVPTQLVPLEGASLNHWTPK
jgi:hypothetical protein